MAEYQQRLSELLELCQSEWVLLESMGKEVNVTTSTRHATKDLRDGIKQLVQLQDNLDEIGNIVVNNTEWMKRADTLMEDVRKRLQFATRVTTAQVKPVTSQSSPLLMSRTLPFQPSKEIKEEEEEESYLDASEELPLDLTVEPTSSHDLTQRPTSSASISSNCSSSIKSIDSVTGKPFGRRSVLLDDMINNTTAIPSKSKSLFPLLKGLRTSQSTPVGKKKINQDAPAQINFFKDDDRNADSKHFIFATDAIVDHPLRIGVGYGSYICYSCTILSDKGAPITVRKRYSDFVDLREELIKHYPALKKSLPKLPPKKVVGKFTPTFVEQRRRELEYFFKYVVLHPVVGANPIVKHWIAP